MIKYFSKVVSMSTTCRLATVHQFQVLPPNKLELYLKKRQRELVVRDADKDGFISRADYELIIQRHIDLGTPAEKVKQVRELVEAMCASIGLTDYDVKQTYEENDNCWRKQAEEMGITTMQFEILFDAVDLNNDGEVSFEEWIIHNKALGINSIHARASFDAMSKGDEKVSKEQFVDYHMEFYYTGEDNLKSSILYGPLD